MSFGKFLSRFVFFELDLWFVKSNQQHVLYFSVTALFENYVKNNYVNILE